MRVSQLRRKCQILLVNPEARARLTQWEAAFLATLAWEADAGVRSSVSPEQARTIETIYRERWETPEGLRRERQEALFARERKEAEAVLTRRKQEAERAAEGRRDAEALKRKWEALTEEQRRRLRERVAADSPFMADHMRRHPDSCAARMAIVEEAEREGLV